MVWLIELIEKYRIFYVGEDRKKTKLMNIIKQNVYTSVNRIHNNDNDNDNENLIDSSTRIYTDCFDTYQIFRF